MKYYFIDKEIYFQNKKMPDRKVELFDVELHKDFITNDETATGYDEDGNFYEIPKNDLIIEEDK